MVLRSAPRAAAHAPTHPPPPCPKHQGGSKNRDTFEAERQHGGLAACLDVPRARCCSRPPESDSGDLLEPGERFQMVRLGEHVEALEMSHDKPRVDEAAQVAGERDWVA